MTMLYIKYTSFVSCCCREDFFIGPHNILKLWAIWFRSRRFFYVFPMTTPGRARMDPRGRVGQIYSRIYKEDHYTLLHTKYESFGPCGFAEEDFLKFFP